MTNPRLEFLRQWYHDTQALEQFWLNCRYSPPNDPIPYTVREIDLTLAGLRQQLMDISVEIKQSREDLR